MDYLGIIGNLIASTLIFVAGATWRSAILPHLRRATYRGIDLSGEWAGEVRKDNAIYKFNFKLQQYGSKLKGTFQSDDSYRQQDDSFKEVGRREYTVSGIVQDGHLFVRYETSNKEHQGLGGFLFSVESQGRELLGHMLFLRSTRDQRIGTTSNEIVLRKTR